MQYFSKKTMAQYHRLLHIESANFIDVIRCCLIDKIIQPIGIQQMRMGTPSHNRSLSIIIIGIIILRNCNRQSSVFISQILLFKGICVILGMPSDKYLSPLAGFYG